MPYQVNFTDKENKLPITVYDNIPSKDTSLVFPGRNVTGYGTYIAENFLGLLENFASATEPINPVEGQLWYDSTNGVLQLWDNTTWKAASNIQKSNVEPSVETSRVGELWVDTNNQQLRLFSGTRWILVGPDYSTGLRSGPLVEEIIDSDNVARVVLSFYVEDELVSIVSKDSFTPKISISGFSTIKSGMNVSTTAALGVGGLPPKFYGTALDADALNIAGSPVEASKFLRTDIINTTEQSLNIRNNSGITLGVDGTFSLSNSTTAAKIYNSSAGSSIDLQINQDGIPSTILRVVDGKVGVNTLVPGEALDITGNIAASGSLILTSTVESTNFGNGTFRTAGGIAVAKNVLIGTTLNVAGTTSAGTTQPNKNDTYDLGTVGKRWNTVRTKTLVAESIEGVLTGNITGNADTATSLKVKSYFSLTGDVVSNTLTFDGQDGGTTKIFSTTLTSSIISSKDSIPIVRRPSDNNDRLLVYREFPSEVGGPSGLFKAKKTDFLQDAAVPIGAIMPYAGANAPDGYLLCDGAEVEKTKYSQLYDIVGTAYGVTTLGVNTFRLPDLRGRFALGRDNMDNGLTVPNSVGGYVDAGGGNIDRVPGTAADNLAGVGGQDSNVLTVSNLPEHKHNMKGSTGQQYYASRIDTAVPLDTGSFSDRGPTSVGQNQYLPSSGGIDTAAGLSEPFSVMNPFLTLNYIIRSGPPAF